jgi:hypothetical protein
VSDDAIEHPELAKLRQFGIAPEQLNQYHVLCLSENLLAAGRQEDLLDSQDSIDLAKRLREFGMTCATSLDLTPQAATVQRRGGDLWLGIVWLYHPAGASTLAKALAEKLKSWLDRNKGRKERWKVHLRLRIRWVQDVSELAYVGDGETLLRLLDGLVRTAPVGKPDGVA